MFPTRCMKRQKSFSEEELVNLTLAIITIDGWNRLAITFRWVPGEYQPGMYNTEGVKA
jgi:alkylhydroperoxidase family enzyme